MTDAIQRLLASLDDLLSIESQRTAELPDPQPRPEEQSRSGVPDGRPPHSPMLGGDSQRLTGNEPALNAEKTLPIALDALHDPDVRDRAARTLIRLGDAAVPSLLAQMHDDDPDVRQLASWALGQIADRRLAHRLRRGAHWTYHALQEPHDGRLTGKLIDALRFGSRESAVASAVALGRLRSPRALPDLTEALNDSYPLIRLAAIWALGQIGAADSVEHLTDALYDPDSTIARVAADALRMLDTPDASAALVAWQIADS
jgi:HEAT repeat protein